MKYSQILLGIGICIAVEFVVYNVNHKYEFFRPIFNINSPGSSEKHQGGTGFTSPLLECSGIEDSQSFPQFSVSKEELNTLVNKLKSDHNLEVMSVYVRDLNNGPWIGINQDEKFIGGSLLKVPMLISYLKLSESNSDILNKIIKYEKEEVSNVQYFSPSKQIEVGKSYTVAELLEYMVYYSDNNAAYLLSQNIDHEKFDEVFRALGFGDPDLNKPYPVDVKTYASFFRILFNASYLNRLNSEKALNMLSKVEFKKGLQDLIPKDLIVSHKFGIRTDGDLNQLHDCGIIYYPGHPYLLCIMSRGGTFENMASSIAEVSKFVYAEVSKSSN